MTHRLTTNVKSFAAALFALAGSAALYAQAATPEPGGFEGIADQAMGALNAIVGSVLFFDVMFWDPDRTLPFIVLWLVVGSVYLTMRMGFINFRAFTHAINVTRGKYTDPSEPGDVSHFEALSTALPAWRSRSASAGLARPSG